MLVHAPAGAAGPAGLPAGHPGDGGEVQESRGPPLQAPHAHPTQAPPTYPTSLSLYTSYHKTKREWRCVGLWIRSIFDRLPTDPANQNFENRIWSVAPDF